MIMMIIIVTIMIIIIIIIVYTSHGNRWLQKHTTLQNNLVQGYPIVCCNVS